MGSQRGGGGRQGEQFYQVDAFAYKDPLQPGLSLVSRVQSMPLHRCPQTYPGRGEKGGPTPYLKGCWVGGSFLLVLCLASLNLRVSSVKWE